MNTPYSSEILYIGFILPSLFAVTLVIEGVYKIVRHEEGGFTLFMGIFFILGLAAAFLFINGL